MLQTVVYYIYFQSFFKGHEYINIPKMCVKDKANTNTVSSSQLFTSLAHLAD